MNKAKREAIAARLSAIAADNNGKLRVDDVLADAKKSSSPLHDQFEWDDTKAAEKYRLVQARALVVSVRTQVETSTSIVSTVCYTRDPEAGNEQGYVEVEKLRDDDDLAREALTAELIRAQALFVRAESLAVALGLTDQFGEIKERVDKLRNMLDLAA